MSLRASKGELSGKRLTGVGTTRERVPASRLKVGDLVLVEAGDLIPADGEVVDGNASVNEAAITGEGPAHTRDVEYLRVVMRAPRRKIEVDPSAPARLRNEPGVGYRLLPGRGGGRPGASVVDAVVDKP